MPDAPLPARAPTKCPGQAAWPALNGCHPTHIKIIFHPSGEETVTGVVAPPRCGPLEPGSNGRVDAAAPLAGLDRPAASLGRHEAADPCRISTYPTAFARGAPGPRNGSVRLRTRLVVVLPNCASSSTISSKWAIDVVATFMT